MPIGAIISEKILSAVRTRTARCSRRGDAAGPRELAEVTWLQLRPQPQHTHMPLIHTCAFACRLITSTVDAQIAAGGPQTEATANSSSSRDIKQPAEKIISPNERLAVLSVATFRQSCTRTTDLIPPSVVGVGVQAEQSILCSVIFFFF